MHVCRSPCTPRCWPAHTSRLPACLLPACPLPIWTGALGLGVFNGYNAVNDKAAWTAYQLESVGVARAVGCSCLQAAGSRWRRGGRRRAHAAARATCAAAGAPSCGAAPVAAAGPGWQRMAAFTLGLTPSCWLPPAGHQESKRLHRLQDRCGNLYCPVRTVAGMWGATRDNAVPPWWRGVQHAVVGAETAGGHQLRVKSPNGCRYKLEAFMTKDKMDSYNTAINR